MARTPTSTDRRGFERKATQHGTVALYFWCWEVSVVGKNIALLELTKFIPEFFRRFDVSIIDTTRCKTASSWVAVQSGLYVHMKIWSQVSLVRDL
jgi:hypothetical protein